jgi:proteasome lid subunit RPN8/RPN11
VRSGGVIHFEGFPLSQIKSITVDRKAEAAFRRRALKAYPNEFIDLLLGKVVNGVAHVCVFAPIEQKATTHYVEYDIDEMQDVHENYADLKLELIGSVHSHPDCVDAHFSIGDLLDVQDTDERVMGICSIAAHPETGRKSCKILYWPACRPLPVTRTGE